MNPGLSLKLPVSLPNQDAQSLGRGMLMNLFGAIPKLLYPVLLVVVVRLYGMEIFGVYTLVEATLFFALYLVLLGLDKGLLFWLPKQPPGLDRSGIRPALIVVGLLSTVASLALYTVGSMLLPNELQTPVGRSYLFLMALALPLLAIMQILVHAALAKRDVAAQVIWREGAVSLILVFSALGFWYAGIKTLGLALAFLLSNTMGLFFSILSFRRRYRGTHWPAESFWPHPQLLRFSLPMGVGNVLAALLSRLDLTLVAHFSDATTLGIYAAILQLGKAVRTSHVSFGHLVFALCSEMGLEPSIDRLRQGFSHATLLVMMVLGPLLAFILTFSPWILSLFGPGAAFETTPAMILCGFLALDGVLGLHGQLLLGYGHSKLCLLNMTLTLLLQALLLLLLVPRHGLYGAALAVGLSTFAQNVLQMAEVRRQVKGPLYLPTVWPMMRTSILAGALAFATWALFRPSSEDGARMLAFLVFLLFFGLKAWPFLRAMKIASPS